MRRNLASGSEQRLNNPLVPKLRRTETLLVREGGFGQRPDRYTQIHPTSIREDGSREIWTPPLSSVNGPSIEIIEDSEEGYWSASTESWVEELTEDWSAESSGSDSMHDL